MEPDHQGDEELTEHVSGRSAFNLALLAILGMYLAACSFVHPIADDFVFARDARAGLWTAWLSEYAGFSGRYASNALVLSGPASWGAAGYRAAAALMLIGVPAAAYAFVRAWFADTLSRTEALTCALVFSALYVSQMPSPGEGIYWYTAAATHHAPLVLVLLHFAFVLRSLRGERGARIYLFAAIVLLVAVAGFNEVMTLLLLGFYGAWTVWSAGDRTGASGSRVPGILLAVTAACAVAIVASPGNTVRQGLYATVHHRFLYSAGMTALQTLRFSVDWVSSGALLLATVLFAPLAAKWAQTRAPQPSSRSLLIWLAAGLLLVIPAAVFPAYWETGLLGQHRTVNTAYFAFLVLWFTATAIWVAGDGRHAHALRQFSNQFRVPLAILLLAALAVTHNSYALGLDLVSGRLANFSREMTSRDAALRACREHSEQTCRLDGIQARPASFLVLDVSADPHDFVNESYARYFELREVRLVSGGAR